MEEKNMQFYEMIINSLEQPVVVIDGKYDIIIKNRYAEDVLYYEDDILPDNIEKIMDALDINFNLEEDMAKLQTVLDLGIPIKMLKEKKGEAQDVECFEISLSPIRNVEGKIKHIIVNFYDIKEYKIMEHELENSLSLFRATLESTVDGILVMDNQNNVVTFNKKFIEMWNIDEEMTKLSKKNVLTSMLRQIFDSEDFSKKLESYNKDSNYEENGVLEVKKEKIFEYYSIPQKIENRRVGRVWSFRDSTNRKKTEMRLEKLAHYDSLTGLANRMLFFDRLENSLEQTVRYKYVSALLFMDLDRFKVVNDSLGHDAGDLLLKKVSARIETCLRKSDTIARMGGDEFTVILSRIKAIENAGQIAEKIIQNLTAPFMIMEYQCVIGVSIGITIFPNDGNETGTLVKNADTAMYHAKESGRNTYRYFTEKMNSTAIEKMEIENDLRKGIENEEFRVFYQPQINLKTAEIIGLEALVRWEHPKKGLVSPGQFIPIAEETGLIVPIGEIVMKQAFEDRLFLYNSGYKKFRMAINLSSRQFREKNMLSRIKAIMKDYDISPDLIELEITESIAMDDIEETIKILNELNLMKIFLSIDDFGTGYSSLSYLKKFPINKLKIDRSFIMNIENSEDDKSIVHAIVAMSHSLNIDVIAEGVETGGHLEQLLEVDCDEVQGYLFGKPMPLENIEFLLQEESYKDILMIFADIKMEEDLINAEKMGRKDEAKQKLHAISHRDGKKRRGDS